MTAAEIVRRDFAYALVALLLSADRRIHRSLAAFMPARRAAAIDAMRAIRHE